MKDSYTPLEVITLLVNNNNAVMQLIDKSKYFVIQDSFVVTFKKRLVLSDVEINRITFDEAIIQAGGVK